MNKYMEKKVSPYQRILPHFGHAVLYQQRTDASAYWESLCWTNLYQHYMNGTNTSNETSILNLDKDIGSDFNDACNAD